MKESQANLDICLQTYNYLTKVLEVTASQDVTTLNEEIRYGGSIVKHLRLVNLRDGICINCRYSPDRESWFRLDVANPNNAMTILFVESELQIYSHGYDLEEDPVAIIRDALQPYYQEEVPSV